MRFIMKDHAPDLLLAHVVATLKEKGREASSKRDGAQKVIVAPGPVIEDRVLRTLFTRWTLAGVERVEPD